MATKLELHKLSIEELKAELATVEKQYQGMKYQNLVATLADTSKIAVMRRNVARIKTELRARELAELEKAGPLKRDKIRARRKRAKKA